MSGKKPQSETPLSREALQRACSPQLLQNVAQSMGCSRGESRQCAEQVQRIVSSGALERIMQDENFMRLVESLGKGLSENLPEKK